MIDLGQSFYEKKHFFNSLLIHQIIVNPTVENYPPVFLLCKERRGKRRCEYALGASLEKLNSILMDGVSSTRRISLAERLAEIFIPTEKKSKSFKVSEVIGVPLRIDNIDLTTELKCFSSEPDQGETPLFFFEVVDNE